MILFITQRKVVKRLHKLRWLDQGFFIYNLTRFKGGIPQDKFISILFADEFCYSNKVSRFLKWLLKKIRPQYLKTFHSKIEYAIELCIGNGYIKPPTTSEKHLVVTGKGLEFVSPVYYWKHFYNNPHIQQLISWVIPIISIWVLSHFFDINITPR
ncbi:MAG: hypothetical protein RJA61_388 [Candidatus Parcubacteria bacterium]|jgi:hypothetical protein